MINPDLINEAIFRRWIALPISKYIKKGKAIPVTGREGP
jgi:hypothetical protein